MERALIRVPFPFERTENYLARVSTRHNKSLNDVTLLGKSFSGMARMHARL